MTSETTSGLFGIVPARSAGRIAGNTATGVLKLIALFFMIIDHTGKELFRNNQDMRILGRIAFPIYVWCMIVGFERTRSVPKYLLRILGVGLISQLFYMPAMSHTWSTPNVFLTLFLGLCALWGIREKRLFSHLWAPLAALILATVLHTDYGWRAILLFITLYAVRNSRPGIASVMLLMMIYWGTSYRQTSSLFGMQIDLTVLPDYLSVLISPFLRMETYALLSLLFILPRFSRDIRMPRWLGYALYPGHLLIIILLKYCMGIPVNWPF